MLIHICFRDALQPSLLICSWKMTFIQYCSWHDKCTEFAVNLYYFQVLALYKKVVERNQSW